MFNYLIIALFVDYKSKNDMHFFPPVKGWTSYVLSLSIFKMVRCVKYQLYYLRYDSGVIEERISIRVTVYTS